MDHLHGNVIRHGQGNEDNVVNKEKKISCTSVTDKDLEKILHAKIKEFNSKIEMGRSIKLLVDKHGYNVNGFDNDMKEALKTYELHGETKSEIEK